MARRELVTIGAYAHSYAPQLRSRFRHPLRSRFVNGHPIMWGMGALGAAPDSGTVSAAQTLAFYLQSNGASRAAIPAAGAFQNAYNASGMPGHLVVDSEYGPQTQSALALVLRSSGDTDIPITQNAFPELGPVPDMPGGGSAPPAPPSPRPKPSPVAPPAPAPAEEGGGWLLPVALVGGAGGLAWLWMRRKRHAHATNPMRRCA